MEIEVNLRNKIQIDGRIMLIKLRTKIRFFGFREYSCSRRCFFFDLDKGTCKLFEKPLRKEKRRWRFYRCNDCHEVEKAEMVRRKRKLAKIRNEQKCMNGKNGGRRRTMKFHIIEASGMGWEGEVYAEKHEEAAERFIKKSESDSSKQSDRYFVEVTDECGKQKGFRIDVETERIHYVTPLENKGEKE
ncbi:MAG: hypothetical protein HQM08_17305 [Candidatus Riflebacteria bacterium]|nr:hypothetical protein [Candidatus Riflebacteria bacterium]